MIAFKLIRIRNNGTLGPLFIEQRRVLPQFEWMESHDVPTKGYAYRPGWHCCADPIAPHLKLKDNRAWFVVELDGKVEKHERPEVQGGIWYTATRMKIHKQLPRHIYG